MAEMFLSIPLPSSLLGGAAPLGRQDDGKVHVQLLDEKDRPVGTPVVIEPPQPIAVEGRGEGGLPEWAFFQPPASLALDIPVDARKLRVDAGGGAAPAVHALSALGSGPAAPPAARKRFPDAGARWMLAVVSERFGDQQTFFAECESLFNFIKGQAPFGDADVSFGIEGLFWPCRPGKTLFGASDDKIRGRVLSGDPAIVKRFLAAAGVKPRKTIVLINSDHRAGAGGFKGKTPSWTTNSADPPERWEGIALHELGHAFGLADEYDSAVDLAEPSPLEPNVSASADPLETAWRHLCNVPAPRAIPTAPRGRENEHDLGTVGTFQGARYREADRYRPSPFCRMRMTTFPFCRVCREQIRKELLA